jgi:hypothetical protein
MNSIFGLHAWIAIVEPSSSEEYSASHWSRCAVAPTDSPKHCDTRNFGYWSQTCLIDTCIFDALKSKFLINPTQNLATNSEPVILSVHIELLSTFLHSAVFGKLQVASHTSARSTRLLQVAGTIAHSQNTDTTHVNASHWRINSYTGNMSQSGGGTEARSFGSWRAKHTR